MSQNWSVTRYVNSTLVHTEIMALSESGRPCVWSVSKHSAYSNSSVVITSSSLEGKAVCQAVTSGTCRALRSIDSDLLQSAYFRMRSNK